MRAYALLVLILLLGRLGACEACDDAQVKHGLPTKVIAALDPNQEWPVVPELADFYDQWGKVKAEREKLGGSMASELAKLKGQPTVARKQKALEIEVRYSPEIKRLHSLDQQYSIQFAKFMNQYVRDHCACGECVERRKGDAERAAVLEKKRQASVSAP